MSKKSQRRATSMHKLLKDSGGWKPFSALQHAETKLLLHTDLERVLTAYQEAGVECLMDWDYYARVKKEDPKYARKVRLHAQACGIPEQRPREVPRGKA